MSFLNRRTAVRCPPHGDPTWRLPLAFLARTIPEWRLLGAGQPAGRLLFSVLQDAGSLVQSPTPWKASESWSGSEASRACDCYAGSRGMDTGITKVSRIHQPDCRSWEGIRWFEAMSPAPCTFRSTPITERSIGPFFSHPLLYSTRKAVASL
jgi:hypothetical protein